MRTFMKALMAVAMVVGTGGLLSQGAFAADPYGMWKRPKTGAHIKVYRCGGGLGMRVVKAKNKKSRGKRLMCGAKKSGSKWNGVLHSSEDGKTYSGTVSMSGGKLKLTGCAMSIFCKTEHWKRL